MNNRAFFYGESVFTTLCYSQGKFLGLTKHLNRLWQGVKFIFPQVKVHDFSRQLEKNLNPLVRKKNTSLILRLTCYLENKERTLKSSGEFCCHLQEYPLKRTSSIQKFFLKEYPGALYPSFFKAGNYLDKILIKNHLPDDENALLHAQNRVLSALNGNIFFEEKGVFYTPQLSLGVLAGISRNYFISYLRENNYTVVERDICPQELATVSGLYLTNSVLGVVPGASLGSKSLAHDPQLIAGYKEYFNEQGEVYSGDFEKMLNV